MNVPLDFKRFLKALTVQVTLLPIVALVVAIPSLKFIPVYWPKSIVEHIYPDGSIRLVSSGDVLRDDAVARSRPLQAARIQRNNGTEMLGYVLTRTDHGAVGEVPVAGSLWRPSNDCEFSWKSPADVVSRESCAEIDLVVRPNRMPLVDRFVVAAKLMLRHGSIGRKDIVDVAAAGDNHQQSIESQRNPGAIGEPAPERAQ